MLGAARAKNLRSCALVQATVVVGDDQGDIVRDRPRPRDVHARGLQMPFRDRLGREKVQRDHRDDWLVGAYRRRPRKQRRSRRSDILLARPAPQEHVVLPKL